MSLSVLIFWSFCVFVVVLLMFRNFKKNFIFWLSWVFFAVGSSLLQGFSPVVVGKRLSNCSVEASHFCGFSCCGVWSQGHKGFSSCSSWALESGLSSCGKRAKLLRGMWNLPGSGSKRCLLHWQADSWLLRHQGSPHCGFSLNWPDDKFSGTIFHRFIRHVDTPFWWSEVSRSVVSDSLRSHGL